MFEVWGVKFYGYGFLVGLGVWVAMEIAFQKRVTEKVLWWTVISGVIGARLYHVIDYYERYYSTHLINIFYLWEGGLGIWGAIGGGLIGLLIVCHFCKLKYLVTLDKIIVGVPLAQAVGRVGNFINGELTGKNGEPLFAYEGVLDTLLFLVLWQLSKRQKRSGVVFGGYLLGYGLIRMGLENLRIEESIWRVGGAPMAVICGLVAVLGGVFLIFRQKQS